MRFIMIILYYILKYFIVQIFIHLHARPEELTVSRFFAKHKKKSKLKKKKQNENESPETYAQHLLKSIYTLNVSQLNYIYLN